MNRETTLLIAVVLTLVGLGTVMVFSTTAIIDSTTGALGRQFAYAALGLVVMFTAARFDYHRLRDPWVYGIIVAVAVVLLITVLIPGVGVRVSGGQRWLRVLGFQFQPSEFAKFALIVLLAVKLTENQPARNHLFKGYLPPVLTALAFAGFVLAQRDLGVPVMLMLVAIAMLWAAGVHWGYIVFTGAASAAGALTLAIITPHRLERLLAFRNPFADRDGSGFQLIQSLRAFAEGEVFGTGLGMGEQKLNYLFAAHTDFIFAVIGEELGLVGTLIVVVLFALFVFAAFRIAANARDLFGSLLATGITALLGFQAAIIMAVTVGLLPTKGMTLPFLSYGGTALVVSLGLVGLLVSVGAQSGRGAPEHPAVVPSCSGAHRTP